MKEHWLPLPDDIPAETADCIRKQQTGKAYTNLLKHETHAARIMLLLNLLPGLEFRKIYDGFETMLTQKKLRELLDALKKVKAICENERRFLPIEPAEPDTVSAWLQLPAFRKMRESCLAAAEKFLHGKPAHLLTSYAHLMYGVHSELDNFRKAIEAAGIPPMVTPYTMARLLRLLGSHENAYRVLNRFRHRPDMMDPRISTYESYSSGELRALYYRILKNKHEEAHTQPESMQVEALRDNILMNSLNFRCDDTFMSDRRRLQELCRTSGDSGLLFAIIFHELQSGSWDNIRLIAARNDAPDEITTMADKLTKWQQSGKWSALRGLNRNIPNSSALALVPLIAIVNSVNGVSMNSALNILRGRDNRLQENAVKCIFGNLENFSYSEYKQESAIWDTQKPIGLLLMLLSIMRTGGLRTPEPLITIAVDACFTLHTHGLTLYSWYMACILCSLQKVNQETRDNLRRIIQSRTDLPALPGLTVFASEDEIILDKFLTLTREIADAAAAPETGTGRLEWLLTAATLGYVTEITPILCKRTAKGKLSPGREIALSALCKGKYDDYVQEEDKAIINRIRRESSYYYEEYSLPLQAAELLCRHPHVRVQIGEQVYTTGATITRVSPRLIMRRNGEYMDLSMPADAERVRIEKTGSNTFDLYLPTAGISKLRQLIQNIGRNNVLSLPMSSRDKVAEALTSLSTQFSLSGDLELTHEHLTELEAAAKPVILLKGEHETLSGQICIEPFPEASLRRPGKGERQEITHRGEEKILLRRNLERETREVRKLLKACPTLKAYSTPEHHFRTDDPETALSILAELQDFGSEKAELRWPDGCTLSLSSLTRTSFQITASEGAGQWLEIGGKVKVDEGLVLRFTELLNLYRSSKGSNYIRLDENRYLRLTGAISRQLDTLSALQPLPDKSGKVKNKLSITPAGIALLARHCTPGQLPDVLEKPVQKFRDQYDSQHTPGQPRGLRAELRSYQKEGFRWLMQQTACGLGACLADDMGLGKTLQILTVLLARAAEGPSLVLAPASVCGNWVREAARFTPGLRTIIMGNTQREETLQKLGPRDVLVCSYGLLVTEADLLSSLQWNVVVLDEAQAIKNSQSQRAENTRRLNARYRIAATGTPLENNLMELWSLMQFLNPEYLGSQSAFMSRFKDATGKLHKLVAPFILRRLKTEVLDELPEKTELIMQVDLNTAERALYESVRREAMQQLNSESGRFQVLAMLTRLRRLCCLPSLVAPDCGFRDSSKMEALRELTAELRASGHRALIFSQFTDVLAHVQQLCAEENYSFLYLDGSTPAANRMKLVDTFQQGETDFFLISLKAGGVGLNLTAADYVILLDPWWNPAVEDQAADRTHRIGQKKTVTVCRLVCSDTIEEKVLSLHARKREMFDSIINDSDGNASTLSVQELMELMS